ncbi:MAG: hypothetical protein PHU08_02420 [Dehalococcoidales bacterium]|nr:hypothetical protein [Dehalococcoidales bacterium]
MKIPCFRCGKLLESSDTNNADYIMAPDIVVNEEREVLFALKHNAATLAKQAMMAETEAYLDEHGEEVLRKKYPGLTIEDYEYDAIEIPNLAGSNVVSDLVKVVSGIRSIDIPKTGIICPECYRDGDFVIWGVHKKDL